jgi:hypothetical protein
MRDQYRIFAVALVMTALVCVDYASAFQLITEQEAALPLDVGPSRGITRGPKITVLFPPGGAGLLSSPLHFKVKFEGRGEAKINLDSALVTYERIPAIDLTQRIKKFITPEGIDIADAEVPPGTHRIRIDISDQEGRMGSADVIFTIAK